MDAHRHAQLDRADRALGLADLLDRPLHVGGGAGGALGVALADEEQEQRVAAELEHVAAVPLGDRDQIVEDRRDALHELLGAGLAVDREPLGEGGEARDVDRDERAVDGPLRAARRAPRSSRGRGAADRARVPRAGRRFWTRLQHGSNRDVATTATGSEVLAAGGGWP